MGNEGSVPVSYGQRLLNDVKIDWMKAEDNHFSRRDGHCSVAVGSKLYVFGGVKWDGAIGEVSESKETLIYDNSKCFKSKIRLILLFHREKSTTLTCLCKVVVKRNELTFFEYFDFGVSKF